MLKREVEAGDRGKLGAVGPGCWREAGLGEGTKVEKGERLGAQMGGNLFYNKNRSSNLSRMGLWEPQRAVPTLSEEGWVGGHGVGGELGFGFRSPLSLVGGRRALVSASP